MRSDIRFHSLQFDPINDRPQKLSRSRKRHFALRTLALGALVILVFSSCGSEQASALPELPGSAPIVHQAGDAEVIMEPARELQEVVSPAGAGCTLDAAKICAAYGQLGNAAGDSRTVSLQIPNGPAIAVQCRYAGGTLVSASAPPDTPLSEDSQAFLAAHGFCAGSGG